MFLKLNKFSKCFLIFNIFFSNLYCFAFPVEKEKKGCEKFLADNQQKISLTFSILTVVTAIGAPLFARWYQANKPYWSNNRNNTRIINNCKKFLSIENNIDVDEIMNRYDENISKIKGQDIIKKKVRSFLNTIIEDIKNKEGNGPHVFYFTGDSGTGKTMMSSIIVKSIVGKNGKIFTIRPGDFCADKGLFSDQIVLGEKYKIGNVDLRKISKFVAYIKACDEKGTIPIIFFDEIADIYDKFDDKNRQINQVEDFLQLLFDNKGFQYENKFYSLKNAIFIFNSNEFIEGKKSSDNSRINIKHKKAFLNRLIIFDFDSLSIENFKDILNERLDMLFEKLNVNNISFDENFLNKVAQISYNKKQGGRVINNYLRFFKSKVNNIVKENELILNNRDINLNNEGTNESNNENNGENENDKTNNYNLKSYKLDFDEAVDEIIIVPIS